MLAVSSCFWSLCYAKLTGWWLQLHIYHTDMIELIFSSSVLHSLVFALIHY